MSYYTIEGHATGRDYLVTVSDGRFWVYPPGSFRLSRIIQHNGYGISYHPGSGREVTAPYPWMSHLRARRHVAKIERRTARAMRRIYHADKFAKQQEKTP